MSIQVEKLLKQNTVNSSADKEIMAMPSRNDGKKPPLLMAVDKRRSAPFIGSEMIHLAHVRLT